MDQKHWGRGVERMLVRIAKFLTSTSLFLAFDGPLLVMFGNFLYGIEINPEILLAAFLAVFSVYSLNKVTDKVEDSINRPETASRAAVYYVGPSIATMILSLGIGISVSPFALFTLMTPIIVGLFYSVRLSHSIPRLKEVVGAKSVLVAFSWSLFGSFLPISLHQPGFEKVALVFTYIFIQVIVNTILFDILDVRGDSVSGLKTLPIVLGIARTKKLIVIINSFLGLWLTECVVRGLFLNSLPALFFGFFYGYLIIWVFSNINCRRVYAELMVDGEWLPIVALLRAIAR